MKKTITRKVTDEIDIRFLEIDIPLDPEDQAERCPPGFPGRYEKPGTDDPAWVKFRVDVDTGQIQDWKHDGPFDFFAFPRDSGTYRLLGPDEKVLAKLEQEYVPSVIPGDGDSMDLKIDAKGFIKGWPTRPQPDFREFFRGPGGRAGDDEVY